MTRLARLTLFFVSIAVVASGAATWHDTSRLYAFLVTVCASALAIGLAMLVDEISWRHRAHHQPPWKKRNFYS